MCGCANLPSHLGPAACVASPPAQLVTQLRRSHMQSPLALCMLIRYTADLVTGDDAELMSQGYEFLDRCLRYNGSHSDVSATPCITHTHTCCAVPSLAIARHCACA